MISREPFNFRFNTSGVFSPYQGWYQRLCYCFTRCKGNGIVLEWSHQLLHLNAHLAQLPPPEDSFSYDEGGFIPREDYGKRLDTMKKIQCSSGPTPPYEYPSGYGVGGALITEKTMVEAWN